jgi:hypothetical protein
MERLPQLSSLLLKAFFTMGRSKNINNGAYSAKRSFVVENLQTEQLKRFKNYFKLKEALPLPYYYLLSQGAQTAMMVEKSFPLPLPGMIHLKSKISQLDEVDPQLGLVVEAEVYIEDKSTGSLLPEFTERYYQNNKLVIEVQSKYLVKRKSKARSKVKREDPITSNEESNWLSNAWRLKRFQSWSYAKLSGDFNPIHLSSIIAFIAGFKRKIIHGWYLASCIVAQVEKETNMPAKSLEINFIKAVYLPSRLLFEFRLGHNRNLEFRISDAKEKSYHISGYIS